MNIKDEIIKQTNGGLDIFVRLYGQAVYENAMGSKKAFCQGTNDKNPSCHMVKKDLEWKLINYGEDGKPLSAIDCWMDEYGLQFREALYDIVDKFYINISLNKEINKPKSKEFVNAMPDEKLGDFNYKERGFTQEDINVWGSVVKLDILRKYNYKALEWYSRVYQDKSTNQLKKIIVYSSPTYPIYMRDCGNFQKVYMPYETDKSLRFFTAGEKPKDYINGLDEAKQAGKGEPLRKLLICSGERDSMCAASMGYYPIWFNSETTNQINEHLLYELSKIAEEVINVPDIDSKGLEVAFNLAKRFWKLKTVLLPEKLKAFKDNRGKPKKDLRDYLEIWDNQFDFNAMIDNALCAQFWWFDEDDKCNLSTNNMLFLLKIYGFYKFKDKISQTTKYIRITDNVIEEYESKEIRDFVRKTMQERHIPNGIIEKYLNSKKCTAALFDDLDVIEPNFEKATINSRIFFFANLAVNVTNNEITTMRNKNVDTFTWKSKIIPHHFMRIKPAFSYDESGQITINHTSSNLFKVMINCSRIFWREEYENRITGNAIDDKQYTEDFKFSINGSRLDEDEIQEQRQNLMNKIFAIGYLIHTFKLPSRAKALWIMENKIIEEGTSNGGTGKSFFVESLRKLGFIEYAQCNGRDKKLTDNSHFLERVKSSTDVLFVDDAAEDIDFDAFYSMITSGMIINPKGKQSVQIDFKESPYVVFTSNFPPPRMDSSTDRRLLPLVYSDYYHGKSIENDYHETRSIRDDFGNRDLMDYDYTEDEYNKDINFVMDCMQYYLYMANKGIVVRPPMDNVYKRVHQKDMGKTFEEWADTYFKIQQGHFDVCIIKSELYENYLKYIGSKGKAKTITNFKKALKAYASFNGYEFNPSYIKGYRGGRITQDINGDSKEVIYMHNPHDDDKKLDDIPELF